MTELKRSHLMPFGTTITDGHFVSRLWAPEASSVHFCLYHEAGETLYPMTPLAEGYHELNSCPEAKIGSRYHFVINNLQKVPDPASRYNPEGVHGASQIVAPESFNWKDSTWKGRPFKEGFIYEMHVGTFTPAGTFKAAQRRLKYLKSKGFTAIEMMPLWECPGDFSWGYDGTLCFAPESQYGSPADLKRFIQAAHALGIMVYIDVVYNHFGPEGNYLYAYAANSFFNRRVKETPWGAAINFAASPVRSFYRNNALYWLNEYNFDGIRFDAVHTLVDDPDNHILDEIADAIANGPGKIRPRHLMLEDERNIVRYLKVGKDDQAPGYDANWNDDFHHAVHVHVTGETHGYYEGYAEKTCGTTSTTILGRTLAHLYGHQGMKLGDHVRGECSKNVPLKRGVYALQNHDQIGNRAFGERLASLIENKVLRAVTAIHLLLPGTILCFQGEEFGYQGNFNFFCDLGAELNPLVTKGRREEFKKFPAFNDPHLRDLIPDPCTRATFLGSKVDWSKRKEATNQEMERLYTQLLQIRMEKIVPLIDQIVVPALDRNQAGPSFSVESDGKLQVVWPLLNGKRLYLFANLTEEATQNQKLAVVSNESGCEVLHATHSSDGSGKQEPWSVTWLLA